MLSAFKRRNSTTPEEKIDSKDSDSKKNKGDNLPEDQEVDIQIGPEYEPEEVTVTDDCTWKSNESSKLLTENLETSQRYK